MVAVAQARFLTLTARASDLQLRIMIISNREQLLAYKTEAIMAGYLKDIQEKYAQLTADSSSASILAFNDLEFQAQYEYAMAKINTLQKQMELEKQNLETQNKAVTTEMESVKKLIENNIKNSFKTFGG